MTLFAISNLEILIRLVGALLLGGLIGIERSIVGKRAGVRTYALVSMGSAVFVIVSELVVAQYLGVVNLDPMRVAAQIVVGIGFLGAGLIIFKGSKLSGLTTAAGLWVSAGVGMSIGFGFYIVGLMVSLLTLFTFTVLWNFEQGVKSISKQKNGSKK